MAILLFFLDLWLFFCYFIFYFIFIFCWFFLSEFVLRPLSLSAQTRLWRPEDGAIISDFSVVDAVAASPWIVYAATRHGLLLYDRRTRVWQWPVTALDGYPPSRVRVALADPAGNAVWLGTDAGWARYDADLRRWDGGPAPGGVSGLLFDAADAGGAVFVRSAAGWSFLPRGGSLSVPGTALPPPERRVQPLDVRTALAAAPMAEAQRALILTDPRLRSYQFTAAARSHRPAGRRGGPGRCRVFRRLDGSRHPGGGSARWLE